jgi:hypothetical protein
MFLCLCDKSPDSRTRLVFMVLFIFLTINLFGVFSFCEFSEFMGVSQSDFQIKVKKYSGNCNV